MAARRFEEAVLPHLDAAYNYARWLTRSDTDAEDVVHDACLRAMRFVSSLRDGDARPWLFAIVRNTWYSRVSKRTAVTVRPFDGAGDERADAGPGPEELLHQQDAIARVRAALEQLPADFREAIVLRDIEGLSYKEIAEIARVPIGTVMSRISRGRERLLELLKPAATVEVSR